MQVAKLMTTDPACCRPSDTLDDVAQLMWDADCGCVPVCAEDGSRRVVGTITDRDICLTAHFRGASLKEIRVSEALSADRAVQTCGPRDSLADVERIMQEQQLRRLPVVDEQQVLVGMISLADLAREAARARDRKRPAISGAEIGDTLAAICESRPERERQAERVM